MIDCKLYKIKLKDLVNHYIFLPNLFSKRNYYSNKFTYQYVQNIILNLLTTLFGYEDSSFPENKTLKTNSPFRQIQNSTNFMEFPYSKIRKKNKLQPAKRIDCKNRIIIHNYNEYPPINLNKLFVNHTSNIKPIKRIYSNGINSKLFNYYSIIYKVKLKKRVSFCPLSIINATQKGRNITKLTLSEKILLYKERPDLDRFNILDDKLLLARLKCDEYFKNFNKPLSECQKNYFHDWVLLKTK